MKKNSANVNLLGHEYAYLFDEIGNRTQTTINSKQSIYTPNALNQYDQRTIPPFAEILGSANTASTVTINNASAQRQADLFFTQIPADNSAGAVYLQNVVVGVRNNADASGNDAVQSGSVKKVVPKNPEVFTYDFDGNVTSDGRFNYTWDGENRLIKVETISSTPNADKKKIEFIYDAQSRRVSKKSYAWNGTAWVLSDSRRFLYDQFNLLAEINDSGTVLNSYAWGTDLSGSFYGAGGVGGLVIGGTSAGASFFPAYDANGNILAYVSNTGTVTAQFEYGPFGELIRSSGTPPCNFGFSTKYRDNETGLNYYGYRYYSAGLGRWLGRDPWGERGGANLNAFYYNNPVNQIDVLGLSSGDLPPSAPDAPSLAQGLKDLENLRGKMKSKCHCCVDEDKETPCSNDADQIVNNLKNAWKNSYLRTKKLEGSDRVGGLFCWHWAVKFKDAADSYNSHIWYASFRRFFDKSSSTVHFAAKISILDGHFAGCFVNVDDGYFDGSLDHDSDWPKMPGWDETNKDTNPRHAPDIPFNNTQP